MDAPALNHLLRTMAAVPPDRRVLVRGPAAAAASAADQDDGRVPSALARLGLEVHAAPWTAEQARRVHRAVEESKTSPPDAPVVYATAAPIGALPYPEAHFGWVVAQMPALEEGAAEGEREAALRALLEEARHHLRPGGWVFVTAPAVFTPVALDAAAGLAALAEAEAPERAERQVHGIYRRVEEHTPP